MMLPRSRAFQTLRPAFRSTHFQALRPRSLQLQPTRRTYAENAAPVSGKPRDWTSRLPLFILAGIAAFLPFYYFSHTSRPFSSGRTERSEAREGRHPSNEYRDPRDTSVKTIEQKMKRDGVDLSSKEGK